MLDSPFPSAAQTLLLSMGLSIILCLLPLAQRLGEWRSRVVARILVVLSAVLGLSWLYLICLWIFKLDVREWLQGHWIWLAVTISLGILAFAYVWPRISKAWHLRVKRSGCLEYAGWLNGGTVSAPNIMGGEASLIEVRNSTTAIPTAANDVVVSILYENAAKTNRFTAPNATWLQIKSHKTSYVTGWTASIAALEGGESQYFVLWVANPDGSMMVYKNSGDLAGIIDYSEWTITIQVTSANMMGFEGTIHCTYARDGFRRDHPAFTMRRRLPPRFPSA